jgi:hypothetical protein
VERVANRAHREDEDDTRAKGILRSFSCRSRMTRAAGALARAFSITGTRPRVACSTACSVGKGMPSANKASGRVSPSLGISVVPTLLRAVRCLGSTCSDLPVRAI